MNTAQSFSTGKLPTWCPGCGDFGIWMSLKTALNELGIGEDDAIVVYGVGCHGNMYSWMKVYGFAGLHGRTLPVAQAIKMANHNLPVIVVSGDGDGLGEGGNHFIHAAKRNPNITVIIHDNQVYGLTTGQAAPTAKAGFKTKSTPDGVVDEPVNPLMLAMTAGATFVSRGFAGDAPGLSKLIKQAIEHKGFSLVDALQPCVTFDKIHTYGWYRSKLYSLESEGYVPDNKLKAFEKAMEWNEKIPWGVFYKEDRPTSEEHEPALTGEPLNSLPLGVSDVDGLLSEFI
jgi:2-oxoglutarate ferredoxin oxidoreductase subunit beta